MMKYLSATALPLFLGLSAFAQGTIILANNSSSLVRLADGVHLVCNAPVGMHVAFYYSPTPVTDPLSPALQLIPDGVGTIAPIPGRFSLGQKTTGTNAPPGSTIYASLRSWTGTITDWESAFSRAMSDPNVLVGYTPVFSMPTGGAGSPPSPAIALTGLLVNPHFTGLVVSAGLGYFVGPPSITGLGVRSNQFGFSLRSWSLPGPTLITVEASDDLVTGNWVPLQTFTNYRDYHDSGSIPNYFSDPDWTNHPRRVYRAWSPY